VTPISGEGQDRGQIEFNLPSPVDTIIHDHSTTGFNFFSIGDIMAFHSVVDNNFFNNLDNANFGVVTPNNDLFFVDITDRAAFDTFAATNFADDNSFQALESDFLALNGLLRSNGVTDRAQRERIATLELLKNAGLQFSRRKNGENKTNKFGLDPNVSNGLNNSNCNN